MGHWKSGQFRCESLKINIDAEKDAIFEAAVTLFIPFPNHHFKIFRYSFSSFWVLLSQINGWGFLPNLCPKTPQKANKSNPWVFPPPNLPHPRGEPQLRQVKALVFGNMCKRKALVLYHLLKHVWLWSCRRFFCFADFHGMCFLRGENDGKIGEKLFSWTFSGFFWQ